MARRNSTTTAQTDMFAETFEDTSLFSGVPMTVSVEEFKPVAIAQEAPQASFTPETWVVVEVVDLKTGKAIASCDTKEAAMAIAANYNGFCTVEKH